MPVGRHPEHPADRHRHAEAGGGRQNKDSGKVHAKQLYIDVQDLEADATFTNIDIGVAAGAINKGPRQKQGEVEGKQTSPGGFAQQADQAVLKDVKQTAWATTAGTFQLSGLHMSLKKGSGEGVECY